LLLLREGKRPLGKTWLESLVRSGTRKRPGITFDLGRRIWDRRDRRRI